ncbi:MAG: cyclodeaminase/cyclohydrolase family protein [Planctomycetes bacterium]|nr:cyclodeaminase/cyclohydrolase family protein [Planctomycetota bacterium]
MPPETHSPRAQLIDLSLTAFTEKLAARTPTPGGGSQAAFLVASGAALVSMAFRFTSGEKFVAVEAAMASRVKELDELRPQALALVDGDSRAYDAVTAAFGLPKSNDAEKSARTAAIQSALKGALEVPFETMRLALQALELAAAGARDINKNLASDCAVGASCVAAALEGAFLNVKINALSIKDAAYVAEKLAACDRMRMRSAELSSSVTAAIQSHLS